MTDEEMAYYSAALDEIWAMRGLMAAEARVLEAHLELKSFPKSRREYAQESVERMREAARGGAVEIRDTWGEEYRRAATELRSIGAKETLTRAAWEAERDAQREAAGG